MRLDTWRNARMVWDVSLLKTIDDLRKQVASWHATNSEDKLQPNWHIPVDSNGEMFQPGLSRYPSGYWECGARFRLSSLLVDLLVDRRWREYLPSRSRRSGGLNECSNIVIYSPLILLVTDHLRADADSPALEYEIRSMQHIRDCSIRTINRWFADKSLNYNSRLKDVSFAHAFVKFVHDNAQ